MIKAVQVYKSYENLEVLRGVNLEVPEGQMLSIIGKSGAGKSTLLHILGTLDPADRGDLWIDGVNVLKLKQKALADFRNEKIGFIFQFHYLLHEFTALENVCIPAYIKNDSRKKAEIRATELLDFLGLRDRLQHKPNELSGGEQQRVAVARALMNKPKVIFADEPTGNLDSVNSNELHQFFLRLKADFGQSFVIVTHNLDLAGLSDRVLTMQDGLLIDN
ncbi:MAG: ABC transporter ATP-binding protein [Saprospiraceae bacterium]